SAPAPPPTQTCTLSLHDALPISRAERRPEHDDERRAPERRRECRARAQRRTLLQGGDSRGTSAWPRGRTSGPSPQYTERTGRSRSEEHTSELQSRENLVCRLLLE